MFTENDVTHSELDAEKRQLLDALSWVQMRALRMNRFDEQHNDEELSLQDNLRDQLTQQSIEFLKYLLKSHRQSTTAELLNRIQAFLEQRWELISGSYLSYTAIPQAACTELCLSLARLLHQHRSQRTIYQYLMPTLTALTDILELYGEPLVLDDIPLEQLILSTCQSALIPAGLMSFFEPMNNPLSDLYHPFLSEGQRQPVALSGDEQWRLRMHSETSNTFYQQMMQLHLRSKKDRDLGTKLKALVESLKHGGARGGRGGTELDAGTDAFSGIIEFMDYWNNLPPADREKYAALRDPVDIHPRTLGDILAILTERNRGFTCVEINASRVEAIISAHPELDIDRQARLKTQQCKMALEQGVSGVDRLGLSERLIEAFGLVDIQSCEDNMWRSLHNPIQQATCSDEEVSSLVCYILRHVSKAALMRGVSIISRELANQLPDVHQGVRLGNDADFNSSLGLGQNRAAAWTVLMDAVMAQATERVRAILDNSNCDAELMAQRDGQGNNLMHLAAEYGCLPVLNYCLNNPECQPLLSDSNHNGYHPLMLAVQHHQYDVVRQMLASSLVDPSVFSPVRLITATAAHRYSVWGVTRMSGAKIYSIFDIAVGDHEMCLILLAYQDIPSSILERRNQDGNTILQDAVLFKRADVVSAIINHPNASSELLLAKSSHGTVFRMAIDSGCDTIFDVLINSPHMCPEVIAMDESVMGGNLLYRAITCQRESMALKLIEHPCITVEILQQKNDHGRTAEEFARMMGLDNVVAAIKAKLAVSHQSRAGVANTFWSSPPEAPSEPDVSLPPLSH